MVTLKTALPLAVLMILQCATLSPPRNAAFYGDNKSVKLQSVRRRGDANAIGGGKICCSSSESNVVYALLIGRLLSKTDEKSPRMSG